MSTNKFYPVTVSGHRQREVRCRKDNVYRDAKFLSNNNTWPDVLKFDPVATIGQENAQVRTVKTLFTEMLIISL
jgi:hypothetical protein